MNILTYTHCSPEELGNPTALEQIEQAKNACDEAGATAYIGRFAGTTFLGSLRDYWA